jgi:hypothetical protein
MIAETDTSGATLREYIRPDDIPPAVVDKVATGSPAIYYVLADHSGGAASPMTRSATRAPPPFSRQAPHAAPPRGLGAAFM